MEKPSYILLSAIEGDWFLNLKCTLALALALSLSLSLFLCLSLSHVVTNPKMALL